MDDKPVARFLAPVITAYICGLQNKGTGGEGAHMLLPDLEELDREWSQDDRQSTGNCRGRKRCLTGVSRDVCLGPLLSFGVDNAGEISSGQGLSVLPDVLVSSSLLDEIPLATSADAFLSKVLCRVQESDTGSWRDFSLGGGGVIQYQRSEDLMPHVCVPHVCRAAVLHTAHGDSVLAGHPGMERTAASVARSYWWPGLHGDVAHFVRSCRTCAAAKSSTALRLGVESHSAVPVESFSGHGPHRTIGPPLDNGAIVQGWQRFDLDMGR